VGRASHTAIVAAALEIPAVSAWDGSSTGAGVPDGDRRRRRGAGRPRPRRPTLERYRQAAAERTARFKGLAGLANLPAETLDGVGVGLWGNIEFPGEVAGLPRARGRRRRALSDLSSCS
jgi:phosphotransferase system enzyme I (PtsI)